MNEELKNTPEYRKALLASVRVKFLKTSVERKLYIAALCNAMMWAKKQDRMAQTKHQHSTKHSL